MIDPMKVRELIDDTHGKFFVVRFIKRTNGELRQMVARIGVHKDVTGRGMSYDPDKKNLRVIRDMHKKDYRMIPLDGVVYFKCGDTMVTSPNVHQYEMTFPEQPNAQHIETVMA